MALHLNLDHQGRVYFALSCDGCGAVFTCYDDGCYSFASLRTEAVFAGWDARQRPEQTHRCPSCLATGATAARPAPDRRAQSQLRVLVSTGGHMIRATAQARRLRVRQASSSAVPVV
jgi:hypothetical protein